MTIRSHQVWAGTALILAAVLLRVFTGADWVLATPLVMGLLCVLVSFAPQDGKGRT